MILPPLVFPGKSKDRYKETKKHFLFSFLQKTHFLWPKKLFCKKTVFEQKLQKIFIVLDIKIGLWQISVKTSVLVDYLTLA